MRDLFEGRGTFGMKRGYVATATRRGGQKLEVESQTTEDRRQIMTSTTSAWIREAKMVDELKGLNVNYF